MVQVTCDNGTFTVGWDNSNSFFDGKGNIAALYCDIIQHTGYVSDTVQDPSLRFYNGVIPTPSPSPSPQPTETATATPSPEPSPSPSETAQETQTATTSPSPQPSESATVQASPSPEPSPQPSETSTSGISDTQTVSQPTESGTVLSDTVTAEAQTPEQPVSNPSSPEPAPSVPTPPPAVEPTPAPAPQASPQPEPQPAPLPVPAPDPLPEPVSEPEPVVESPPEPAVEAPLPVEEPPPAVDETTVPESQPEPAPEPETAPEQTSEPSPVEPQEESLDNVVPESYQPSEPPVVIVAPSVAQQVVQLTPDTDLTALPPDTPVALENGVVVTAEVAIAVELLQNPGELLATVFTDPMAALAALSNVGADLPPEVREKAEDVIVSAVIAGNIATQAAGAAAAAASYRRKP